MSGVLIIAALFALMPTLISLLSLGSVQAMTAMLDERLFKIDRNVITLFEEIFGSQSKLNYLGEASLRVGESVYSLAYALVLLLFMLQIVASLLHSLQGEEAENPVSILLRAVMTIVFLVMIFGAPGSFALSWFPKSGLLHAYGALVSRLLAPVSADFNKWAESFKALNFSLILDPAEQTVLIILSFALFKGVIEAGIVFTERWLTFALTVLFGPVFVSFYASRRTADVFYSWLRQILSQTLSIFISYILLIFFYNSMADLSGVSVIFSNMLFRYALCIALLALYKNSEKLLNSVGLFSIANTSSLKEYGRGVQAFGGLWRDTGGALMMGFGREAARDLGRGWGQSLHRSAVSRFGEDSFLSKASAPFDGVKPSSSFMQDMSVKQKPSSVRSSAGSSDLQSLKGNRPKQDTGMPAGSLIGRTIRAASGKRTVTGEDGSITEMPFHASVFSADHARQKVGSSSVYASIEGERLPVGTEISLGSFADGAGELTYKTGNKEPVPADSGKGYTYEIFPSPLTETEFNADKSLSSEFKSYAMYRSEFEQADKAMHKELDSYDYRVRSSHAGADTTYSSLSDVFGKKKSGDAQDIIAINNKDKGE